MAVTHAANLITEAQSGTRRLSTSERRLCIQYLMATDPGRTGSEMAGWFKVSERTIRVDKLWIRSQKAKFLKNELSKDLALVIADIAMDFEKQVSDIEKSKQKCKLGTKPYLDHCNSVFEMRLRMVKAFQDIGYLPKNLGNMTVEKFEYKAVVNKDGAVNTRSADMFDHKDKDGNTIDGEFTDIKLKELTALENAEDSETSGTVPETVQSD